MLELPNASLVDRKHHRLRVTLHPEQDGVRMSAVSCTVVVLDEVSQDFFCVHLVKWYSQAHLNVFVC